MKKLFRVLATVFSLTAMLATSCVTPPEPQEVVDPFKDAKLEISLVGTDKTTATLSFEAEVVKMLAYVVEPTAEKGTYTAEEIFAKEQLLPVEAEGPTQFTLSGLTPDTNYTIQVAGRIVSDKVWSVVKSFKFTTEMLDPVLTAELGTATATSADFTVHTENISRIAYLVKKVEEGLTTPRVPVIFATGKIVLTTTGDSTIEITELSPNSEYNIYIAGEIAGREEFLEEPVVLTGLKTGDFENYVTVRDLDYRSFKIDLKVDPEIKANNHVIKWGTSDLVTYNNNYFGGLMNNAQGGDNAATMINLNDRAYHNYVQESTTFIFDELHSYVRDSNGNPTDSSYYGPIVPGQPQVVMFGEYKWGDVEEFLGFSYGTPEQNLGYYIPMFNWTRYNYEWSRRTDPWQVIEEDKYWTGFFHKEIVQLQRPEPLPEDCMTIETKLSPKDAVFNIKINRDVELISVMMLEDENYNRLIPYLNNDTSHLQWFATSMVGMYAVSSYTFNPWVTVQGAPIEGDEIVTTVRLSEYFIELARQYDYHIFFVGMAGDYNNDGYIDSHKQVLHTMTIQLPEATKPAPTIVVSAVEEECTPYKVVYNVKCTSGDMESATYAVNSKDEWLRTDYALEDILEMNSAYAAYNFSSSMLRQANGPDGCNIEFVCVPEEELGLAIMGINDEGSKGFSEVVYAKALPEKAPERVESELFESLKGTWTATTTVLTVETQTNEETGEQENVIVETTRSCEVVVGAIEYPETLPQEVYDLYESAVGANKETTDAYYAEFKAAADAANQKTRNWNRILMNGYNFEAEDVPYYRYQSAFDLFCSSTYNGSSSAAPIVDFGPKWYLEIAADGTVTVPFNTDYFDPMSSWYYDSKALYESQLLGYDPANNIIVGYFGGETEEGYRLVNGHFPVEISADGNTITVKPLLYKYQAEDGSVAEYTFYPAPAINYGGGQYDPLEICGDVVLTRNGSAAAPALAPAKAGKKAQSIHKRVESDMKVKERSMPLSRSNFNMLKPANEVKINHNLSLEERVARWHEVRTK